MKNTNTTLAMVAVLAAVTMLSAVLAVPMQQASAGGNGDGRDGDSRDSGGNTLAINQEQECEESICDQALTVDSTQSIEEDGFTPPGQE